MTPSLRHRCLEQLARWLPFARTRMRRSGAGRRSCVYGPGTSSHWDMQAQATTTAAFVIAGHDPDYPALAGPRGVPADEAIATALDLFRYQLQAHAAGGGACMDGGRWGLSWISVLALERLAPGLHLLEPLLGASDRALLDRVLTAEADWLTDEYPVVAGLLAKDNHNRPESNMWNGAFLHRQALRYPDAPRAAAWREKGTDFLVNAVSVPADAEDDTPVDGKSVRQRFVGANFFPSYACNHHNYLNVGYMLITLSNLALFHFSRRVGRWPEPAALHRHADELWAAIRLCTSPDGRLLRVGGDSRVRYCYCQDYAPLVWRWAVDRFGDAEADAFSLRWLDQVRREAEDNPDGSFFGKRLAGLRADSPLYALRLEGDRAAGLAITAWWERVRPAPSRDEPPAPAAALPPEASTAGGITVWRDEYHGAAVARGPRRFASWSWDAAQKPMGLCVPPDADHLAEWRYSMAGLIRGQGVGDDQRVVARHAETLFPGGFVTAGRYVTRTIEQWSEGTRPYDNVGVDLAFAALPDDATVLSVSRAVSIGGMPLTEVKGLYLPIPNDAYNRHVRQYAGAGGTWRFDRRPETDALHGCGGPWTLVDGRLAVTGLYGGTELQIHRPALPRVYITINPTHAARVRNRGGETYVEELVWGICREGPVWLPEPGEVLWDLGFAVAVAEPDAPSDAVASWSGTARQATAATAETLGTAGALRAAVAVGRDGNTYCLLANLGEGEAAASLSGAWEPVASAASARISGNTFTLSEGAAIVLRQ